MGEKGLVVDQMDEMIVVTLQRTEACAKCRACIAGMTSQEMIIHAKNLCHAKKDDWVNIEVDGTHFLQAVMIMYGLPFLAFIFGMGLSYWIASMMGLGEQSEWISFVAALLCTGATYLFIRSKEDYWKSKNYTPVATQILGRV